MHRWFGHAGSVRRQSAQRIFGSSNGCPHNAQLGGYAQATQPSRAFLPARRTLELQRNTKELMGVSPLIIVERDNLQQQFVDDIRLGQIYDAGMFVTDDIR